MLWLGLHFPQLPLETAAAPAEGTDPAVVIDDGNRVMFRNAAAVQAHIAHGSTLATAHGILPGLTHYRRNPERERRRLALLAEALYGFSPRVSLLSAAAGDDPPAGIVLEIGGSLRLFGDAAELVRRAEATCRGMGHEVRARQAATPLAALTLARAGMPDLKATPLARAAVEPGVLTPQRIERFANMGIRTLGQLLALPRRAVTRRFGEDLTDYLDRLTGEVPDPRRSIRPAEGFRAEVHLLEPVNGKAALELPMHRLLTDLQHWLVARQLGAEQLRWHFAGSGASSAGGAGGANGAGDRVSMAVRFARAQQRREAFLEIVRLRLDGTDLPEDVLSLTLDARRLRPWSAESRSLFGDLRGLAPAQAAQTPGELVDQLRARLGQGACYTLETADGHTPEQAWRQTAPCKPGGDLPTAGGRARKRPLWLFDPPRPVDPRRLLLLEGPERIHTGWWLHGDPTTRSNPDEIRPSPGNVRGAEARDYYVARHESGARCWVFTDPRERWYLHGYFS